MFSSVTKDSDGEEEDEELAIDVLVEGVDSSVTVSVVVCDVGGSLVGVCCFASEVSVESSTFSFFLGVSSVSVDSASARKMPVILGFLG